MKQMNDKEGYNLLCAAGFTTLEIHRLSQLRQGYRASEQDQAPLDYAHLRFIQWLVRTGRLTDQIVETHASNEQHQEPVDNPFQPSVWGSIRTLMTQDILHVLPHRPKASGNSLPQE
jgi:hypothetical protein